MITALKILLIIYLLFTIKLIIFSGFKKTRAILRWLNTYIIMGLAHILLPLYPIAYWMRNWRFNIFWILLDDGRLTLLSQYGYAEDYQVWLENHGYEKETWMSAFRWHIERNRLYNLLESFKVYNGDPLMGNQFITIIETVIDELYKNDENHTHINQDGIYVASAGLKYIGKISQDPYQVNQGDIISIKTSILGTGFIWYEVEYKDKNGDVKTWYSFRYSQCKIVKYPFIKPYYRTLRFGTNANRNTFTIKHQKIKKWE